MRHLFVVSLVSLVAATTAADDRPLNQLTAEEIADGWVLLFEGATASGWKIDGDYEVKEGGLILGGKRKTRAYLTAPLRPGFEIRFQYRVEGKQNAGFGWDNRMSSGVFPHPPQAIFGTGEDWKDSYLIEYFDMRSFQQRFIKHQAGTNGIFQPIESVWFEAPAGTKLYLRNMRLKQKQILPWGWVLVIGMGLVGAAMFILFIFARRRRRRRVRRETTCI